MAYIEYLCSHCSTDDDDVAMDIVEKFGRTYAECPICDQSYPYSR